MLHKQVAMCHLTAFLPVATPTSAMREKHESTKLHNYNNIKPAVPVRNVHI